MEMSRLEAWKSIQSDLAAFMGKKARQFASQSGFVDYEDLLQEARFALYHSIMNSWDPEHSSGSSLRTFAYAVLKNTCCNALLKRKRESGKVYVEDCAPSGFDFVAPVSFDPAFILEFQERSSLIGDFERALRSSLSSADLDVYDLLVAPFGECRTTLERYCFGSSKRKVDDIARILGRKNNQIDWSIFNIKMKFTVLAREKRFIDLFGDRINTTDWPQVMISNNHHEVDSDFVDFVKKNWALSDELPTTESDVCGAYTRKIIKYSWGAVIFTSYNGRWMTVVCIGKLDIKQGVVFGKIGTRQYISVSWWKAMDAHIRRNKDK